MRSARGETSTSLSVGIFSPVSVVDATLCSRVGALSLVRPFCLAGVCRTGY